MSQWAVVFENAEGFVSTMTWGDQAEKAREDYKAIRGLPFVVEGKLWRPDGSVEAQFDRRPKEAKDDGESSLALSVGSIAVGLQPRFWVVLEDGTLRENLTRGEYDEFVNFIGTIDGGLQ